MKPALQNSLPPRKSPLCPECEKPTSPHRCDGVLIFKCGLCHGLWLSGGKRLGVFRKALERFNYRQLEIYSDNSELYFVAGCPSCGLVLEKFNYGYNSGVSLHRCARCGGMWMPLKELIRLMESLRLGQSVREDVRAWLKEIRRIHGRASIWTGIARGLKFLTS